jgi:hypothetical protein
VGLTTIRVAGGGSTSDLDLNGPEHRSAQQHCVLQYPLDRILPLVHYCWIGEVHQDQLAKAVSVDVEERVKVCGAAPDASSSAMALCSIARSMRERGAEGQDKA